MQDQERSATDYRLRRGEISAYGRAFASAKHLRYLTLLVAGGLILLLIGIAVVVWPLERFVLVSVLCVLAALILLGLWLVHRYTNEHFIEPDLAFRMWLQQVCDGELDARIGLPVDHRHYKELHFHTLNLTSSLSQLSDDMETLVESQTRRLNDQKRVSELLFKLTSDVSSETEDEAAFETVCDYLAQWFDSACVSCYRVNNAENSLHCVAVRQASAEQVESVVGNCKSREITLNEIPSRITTLDESHKNKNKERWVPFFAGDEPAGVLIVELGDADQSDRIETRRVLSTVSEQLSLLCGKRLVQEQILQARLSRDRNELAAEIHDSLAQTLLAVRYQTTLLSEKLNQQSNSDTHEDVAKIRESIEEANKEVRGLIREYRNPLSEHRYADSLQKVIDQYSQASGMAVFFQSDDPRIRFTPREESVLQRIIGEALNNAVKYADASMIRVYLQRSESGVRRILVEDDGIGFQQTVDHSQQDIPVVDTGEHIGLTIMRERALSIGAKLVIDSEPGEGTRVAITMPPLIEIQSQSE